MSGCKRVFRKGRNDPFERIENIKTIGEMG